MLRLLGRLAPRIIAAHDGSDDGETVEPGDCFKDLTHSGSDKYVLIKHRYVTTLFNKFKGILH